MTFKKGHGNGSKGNTLTEEERARRAEVDRIIAAEKEHRAESIARSKNREAEARAVEKERVRLERIEARRVVVACVCGWTAPDTLDVAEARRLHRQHRLDGCTGTPPPVGLLDQARALLAEGCSWDDVGRMLERDATWLRHEIERDDAASSASEATPAP